MQKIWILAADGSRARIFEALGSNPKVREIDDLANPPGRANNRELRTDAHGRYSGKGQGHHGHVTSPPVDAVEHETELFSKMLGDYLDKARNEHRYDRLYLIAPPKFMGLVRQHLSKEAQKLVEEEITKDISWFDARDVEEYLYSRKD